MKKLIGRILMAVSVIGLLIVLTVSAVSAATVQSSEDLSFLKFDPALYYGRSQLATMSNGANLVKAYDRMVASIERGDAPIWFDTRESYDDIVISLSEMDTVLAAYRFDNPQQFWVQWGLALNYYYYQDIYNVACIDMYYYDGMNSQYLKDSFHTAAVSFIKNAGVVEGMTDYQISKLLHDAVADHVTYEFTDNCYTAYGALMEKKCVCEGYTELYQYLLYLMGIQSHAVTGEAYVSETETEPHEWNLVRLDGKYYQTDITWDDQVDVIFYAYLNTTTSHIYESRNISTFGYSIPYCSATDLGYFYNNKSDGRGKTFTYTPDVMDCINQLRYWGEARTYYAGYASYDIDDFLNWFYANRENIERSLGYEPYTLDFYYGYLSREYVLFISGVDVPIGGYPEGDLDGDIRLTTDDAIYLMYSILYGDSYYPKNQSSDFNKDGKINVDDAVYLLYSALFGEEDYPLN